MRKLTVAGLAAVLAFTLPGCAGGARDASGQVTAPISVDPFQVAVGDCTGELPAGATKTVTLIPCGQAHYWEAFNASTLTDAAYPGEAAISEKAIAVCTAAFKDFVGIAANTSSRRFTYFYPNQTTWNSANDRQVLCLAGSPEGNITGTLKGVKK